MCIIYLVLEAIRMEAMFCHVHDREVEEIIQKYLAQRPFVLKRHEQISKNQLETTT